MALDFPRFELVGVILAVLFVLFFILWLGAYFDLDLMKPIHALFEQIYVFANAGFYFLYFLMVLGVLAIVYVTRWLDYWEILPNEILHHHGPLSDLERFPTHEPEVRQGDPRRPRVPACSARGGSCCTSPTSARRSCWTTSCSSTRKEEALKKLMSRLEVRVTTDQEVAELLTT